jgi:hypothetical protein
MKCQDCEILDNSYERLRRECTELVADYFVSIREKRRSGIGSGPDGTQVSAQLRIVRRLIREVRAQRAEHQARHEQVRAADSGG